MRRNVEGKKKKKLENFYFQDFLSVVMDNNGKQTRKMMKSAKEQNQRQRSKKIGKNRLNSHCQFTHHLFSIVLTIFLFSILTLKGKINCRENDIVDTNDQTIAIHWSFLFSSSFHFSFLLLWKVFTKRLLQHNQN